MKKMLLLVMFAVSIISGAVAGPTGSTPVGGGSVVKNYFPLVEGRYYRYQDKKTGFVVFAVVSKATTILGDNIYKLYFENIDYAIYFEHDENGFRLYQEGSEDGYREVYKVPITLLPSNFSEKYASKKLYTYQGYVGSELFSVGATVVSIKAGLKTVTVPIGVYDTICLAIKTKWIDHDDSKGGTTTVLYGAEGIGFVRITKKGTSKIPGLGNVKEQADLYLTDYWD